MTRRLHRVNAQRAADVAGPAQLPPEALAVLRPEMTPAQYLDALSAAGRTKDAILLLACALGRREAVWWACVGVRSALTPASPPAAAETLQLAESWVRQPAEETRWAAHAAAEAQGFATPWALAALACFFAGPSLTKPMNLPPGYPPQQPVPPDPFLTGRMAAKALEVAALGDDPSKAPPKLATFLSQGIEIASAPAQGGR